jgi:outer membrane receptor protein involved in Fe transport
VSSAVRLTGGVRVDGYRVRTTSTPGYDIESLVEGATPPIDPATLPNVDGDTITRTAVTGEAGLVLWGGRPVSVFAHYVRSYRHPNLEELLFAGPATAGSIVPNVTVRPETGHNVDVGTRFRAAFVTGSLSYFNNTYRNFISTEIVANVGSGSNLDSISQAINLARVRIQGVELDASAPFGAGPLNLLPHASVSYNHGTVLEGTSPLSGLSLDNEPQDNISPWKVSGGLRLSDQNERWWAGYRVRALGRVRRISPLLNESPFLIAQDLLALDGFSVHRLAAGYDWRRGGQWIGLVAAVDNLVDRFYREQFQFAPARGRSFTLTLSVRGTR